LASGILTQENSFKIYKNVPTAIIIKALILTLYFVLCKDILVFTPPFYQAISTHVQTIINKIVDRQSAFSSFNKQKSTLDQTDIQSRSFVLEGEGNNKKLTMCRLKFLFDGMIG